MQAKKYLKNGLIIIASALILLTIVLLTIQSTQKEDEVNMTLQIESDYYKAENMNGDTLSTLPEASEAPAVIEDN